MKTRTGFKMSPTWNNLYKIEDADPNRYEIGRIKWLFSKRLDEVLKSIEPTYTPHWISVQIGMSKQSVMRYLNSDKQPALNSFYRIVDFIKHHIPDFNPRYLFDSDAEIKIKKD